MLILVIGLPGSGKSTVARLLARKLDATVLNSDLIRRELFPESRTYSSQETQAVIKETEKRTQELLQRGATVILDALFTKQRPRDEYKKLAARMGVPFALVCVSAPEALIKERMDARAQVGDASEAGFAYYLDRKPHFESAGEGGLLIENGGGYEELVSRVEDLAAKL